MSADGPPQPEGWFLRLRKQAESALGKVDGEGAAAKDADQLLHELQVSHLELEMQNEELRGAYAELEIAKNKYNDLYDFAPLAYLTLDQRGMILEGNLAGGVLLGLGKRDLLGKLLVNFVVPRDRDVYRRYRNRVINSPGRQTCELKMVRRDGTSFHALLDSAALRARSGEFMGSRTIISDITQRKEAEEALFEEKERAQITLKSIGDGVIATTADAIVEFLNPAAETLTGWPNEEAVGRPLHEIFCVVDEHTRRPVEDPVSRCLHSGRTVGLGNHSLLLSRVGREYAVHDSAAPIRDRTGTVVGAVLVFQDVTEARRLAREIAHQANHDPLTGLVNRREFERRVEHALLSARLHGAQHALCYVDLDRFKTVNDSAGHVAGDELLRQIAGLLVRRVRGRDTVARLGGDEFCLLIEGCPPDKAFEIGDDLVGAIRRYRFFWEGRAFEIGASVGLVSIDNNSESTRQLLTDADIACYTAKDLGRNRVHVHPNYGAFVNDRRHSMVGVAELHRALDSGQFRLFCQPIFALADDMRRPRQYEILLRLLDCDQQIVFPEAFIPTAERYGVMPSIDRWVIRETFRRAAAAMDRGGDPGIAINLSGSSLCDDGLLDFVSLALRETAFPAHRLCFEITETAAIHNLAHATKLILQLREQGCRFALDDFGKGLSSLTYLKNLPVNFLKIDGSFVRDIDHNAADRAMVAAVNQLAHAMNIETIAECVERPKVIEQLNALGVDYCQGYAIGEPRDLGALDSLH